MLQLSPGHQPALQAALLPCSAAIAVCNGGGTGERWRAVESLQSRPLSRWLQARENVVECCFCSQLAEQETISELEPGVACRILRWPPRDGLAAPRAC